MHDTPTTRKPRKPKASPSTPLHHFLLVFEDGHYAFTTVGANATATWQEEVILTSRTWGEFVRRADERLLYFAALSFDDDITQVPWQDDDRFDTGIHLPAYGEGLVPDWSLGSMSHLLPRHLVDAYCIEETSFVGDDYAFVPPQNVVPLANELRALGHQVDIDAFDPNDVWDEDRDDAEDAAEGAAEDDDGDAFEAAAAAEANTWSRGQA